MTGYLHQADPRSAPTGCPCGCLTKLPYFDDPDCIRHRPLPVHDETCCPGEFGDNGRWRPHCGTEAA